MKCSLTRLDVVPHYGDIVVAISPGLFMEETKSVVHFVHCGAVGLQAPVGVVDLLLTSDHANVAPAPVGVGAEIITRNNI